MFNVRNVDDNDHDDNNNNNNSMGQDPSCEANEFSAPERIPRIL